MISLVSFFLATQALLVSQGGLDERVEREAWVMGTRLRVVAEARDIRRAQATTETVVTEVERLDGLLSTWAPDSEMNRINHSQVGVSVKPTGELMALLRETRRWMGATDGAFQPGIGPLIEAWDLRGEGRVPEPEQIERARRASRADAWELDPTTGSIARRDPLAWIDTGAFGKGAALRSAAGLMDDSARADDRVLADLGGQVLALAPEDRPWRVPVAHPADRSAPAAWLLLHDVSAATSGTSERWADVDGERYGHILDPRSGRPTIAWGTVTVVHPDALVADVLATALYVLGPEAGHRWLAGHPEIAALFLESRGNGVRPTWTPAMERWLDAPPPRGVTSLQNIIFQE